MTWPSSATPEIVDPTTGECLNPTDADSLIEAYERIDRRDKELSAAKNAIRDALGRLTSGDAKTRYVRGTTHRSQCALLATQSISLDRTATN